MSTQSRGKRGRFAPKSDENREVRSLRLTDATWAKLGEMADAQSITRADLIEQIVESGLLGHPLPAEESSLQQVGVAINKVLSDPKVTRNGKDRGSVKRALHALLEHLS